MRSRWLGAYVAIWLALVAAHAKTLTSPPYCDFAMGLFTGCTIAFFGVGSAISGFILTSIQKAR